jgi:hypothetical protein
MSGMTIALISASCIFGGTLVGLTLRKMLPEHHLSEESKDAIKIGAGMISMMAALVLGLLVSSAKSNFDSTNTAIIQTGAKVILIDRLLANYGPETKEVRDTLRRSLAAAIEVLWPEEHFSKSDLTSFERVTVMEKLLERIRALKPENEAQRALQGQALQLGQEILLSRWIQIEQAQTALPGAFLIVVLFWLTMLYTTFGVLAPRNPTVITVMLVGALALATAMFLIVEMNRPMGGLIKVSSGPMHKALEHLGR